MIQDELRIEFPGEPESGAISHERGTPVHALSLSEHVGQALSLTLFASHVCQVTGHPTWTVMTEKNVRSQLEMDRIEIQKRAVVRTGPGGGRKTTAVESKWSILHQRSVATFTQPFF